MSDAAAFCLSFWSHTLLLFSGLCLLLHLIYELISYAFKTLKKFYAAFLGVLYRVGFIFLPSELLVYDILGNIPVHFIYFPYV